MKQLIDLKTLSKLNSISVSKLRQLIKQGMPHYKMDRKILIDPDEFFEWFELRFKVKSTQQSNQIDKIVEETLAEFGVSGS